MTSAYEQILNSKMNVLQRLVDAYEKNPSEFQKELLRHHLNWQKERVDWMTANAPDQVQIETDYYNAVEKRVKDLGLL